ncbi:hypothetical protein FKM82_009286, partial [Ascaphus truei]
RPTLVSKEKENRRLTSSVVYRKFKTISLKSQQSPLLQKRWKNCCAAPTMHEELCGEKTNKQNYGAAMEINAVLLIYCSGDRSAFL